MAIKSIQSTKETERKYVRKADRTEEGPDHIPVIPGSLGIADAVYEQVKWSDRHWTPKNVYASKITEDRMGLVLSLLGVPASNVIGADHPEWAFVSDCGTAIHERLEKHLQKAGLVAKDEHGKFRSEFRVASEDGSVTGRVDYELLIALERYIADVKTVGRKDFDDGTYSEKFIKYCAQLNVYGRILGITKGVIILVCRDSARIKEVVLQLDPAEGDRLLLRARAVMNCVRERRLPTAEGGSLFFNQHRTLIELQGRFGWAQRALNEGWDTKDITPERLVAAYAEDEEDRLAAEAIIARA